MRDLLSKIVEIEKEDIVNPVRLGKKKDEKPRLLKISVKTEAMKKQIIMGARDLNMGVPFNKRIYVNQDFTKKQRETYRNLRAEKKRRTDNGEENLVIRGEKIVTLTPKQMTHQNRAATGETQAASSSPKPQG